MVPVAIVLLVLLDQLVKWYVVKNIPLGVVKSFIPHVVSLTYLQNTGCSFFHFLKISNGSLPFITLVVMVGAFYYLYKHLKGSLWMVMGLTLVIAGGLGNFIDRLRQGFVVDMFHLDFMNFAIFNVADSYLTVGVFLLLILMLKEETHGKLKSK